LSQADERKDDAEDEPGMWEETFKSHSDSKPNGTVTLFCISVMVIVFSTAVNIHD